MSALFDGVEIWAEKGIKHPPMTKEQQERWDSIQEDCNRCICGGPEHTVDELGLARRFCLDCGKTK